MIKEYKNKFKIINNNISTLNSQQNFIIKNIRSEAQSDFISTINNNVFLCDSFINPYLDNLFKEVLTKNNLNRDEYKILLAKDSEVNAYSSGYGTIVLNFGLFLSVENEDELLFVICHEIAHNHLNHFQKGIENFAKISTSEEIKQKTKEIQSKKYGKATSATNLLKNLRYENYYQRRKKEVEADSLGLNFYRKTLRNSKSALTLLEKLNHSDEEKDSLTVEDYKSIFEKNGLTLKVKYFDQEESLFNKYDKEKKVILDSLKSHPDCTTRIKLINEYLKTNDFVGSNNNSDIFYQIKKLSNNQNLLNLFASKSFGISLYEALKLYKNDKINVFLKQIIIQNLKEILKAKTNYTINRYLPRYDHESNTESFNRFITFINNIKISELETIINNFKQ